MCECLKKEKGGSGGPQACGLASEHSGYGCNMQLLVSQWRRIWSATPGTTPTDFPFGIVSLAAGTSEGNSGNMAAFRDAQIGQCAVLPCPSFPNTFVSSPVPGMRGNIIGHARNNM